MQHAEYIAVIPIGTTLSTLYHLQRTVAEQLTASGAAPLDMFVHYVLILVGSIENSDGSRLSDQYWARTLSGLVTLSPQKSTLKPLHCQVYLEPQATWQDRKTPPAKIPARKKCWFT